MEHSWSMLSDREHLQDLARRLGQAWLEADISSLDQMLAGEYTHTDVSGRVLHRSEWLADAANPEKWLRAAAGNARPSMEFDDMTVEVLGIAAVITGGNTIHGARPTTDPIRLRFTQVWIVEGGVWKRRYFQAVQIAMQSA
jgi:hypothetical protein